jgi:dTDP-4-amino-4,6-dideoxygalactose transaminase
MLKREVEVLRAQIETAFRTVLDGGQFVGGPAVQNFEQQFAAFCDTRHCIAVANGTDALEISLRSLAVGPGDELITVANAGGYTTAACHMVGATPIYVDVDPATLQMDPAQVTAALTSRTRVLVITHLYGYLNSISRLRAVLAAAGRHDVLILEDCAQAHGAVREGARAGSLGDIAAFSFYPTKNLGAFGDAGAIVTPHGHLAERARQLRQYGWDAKYHSKLFGGRNSRLDPLQAAILSCKLPHLDAFNSRRRDICRAYAEALPDGWRMVFEDAPHFVAHLAVLIAPSGAARERAQAVFQERQVSTDIHYPRLDPNQPAWSQRGPSNVDLPVSRAAVACILTVPCFPHMTGDEVAQVADAIRAAGRATSAIP